MTTAIATRTPTTAFELTQDLLDDYVLRTISHQACKLIGHHGFTQSDQEDIEQELALGVLKSAAHYDPNRGSPHTFAVRCIQHRLVDLIRHKRRQCRDALRQQSIGDEADEPEQNAETYGIDDPDATKAQERCELRMDLASVIGRLPEHLQQICMMLQTHSAFAISKTLGVSKQRIYKDIERIRVIFSQSGLAEYLGK